MIKTLRNISKEDQLVKTTNGKQIVKAWEQFETEKADELLRNYRYLFEIVEEKKVEKAKDPKEAEDNKSKKFTTKK